MAQLRSQARFRAMHETIQDLTQDPQHRDDVLDALSRTPRGASTEFNRVELLLWVNKKPVQKLLGSIRKGGFTFDDLHSDSATVHRKVASLQDLLELLGYYLGPDAARSRGFYGGPPGKPVQMSLGGLTRVGREGSRREKVLETAGIRTTESWTRDAVRRLQHFLGSRHLPSRIARQGTCILRPDGLCGLRTLDAIDYVVDRV
jgi:hypothetical protein